MLTRHASHFLLYIFFISACQSPLDPAHAEPEGIPPTSTLLVDKDGNPTVTIIAPQDDRYAAEIKELQKVIQETGSTLVNIVQDNNTRPEALLSTQSLIVVGNMATSRYIRKLYEQWYTFLDLKYPGPGGSVVRTLNDPYATGHNIILLGGSDDAGVRQAVHDFMTNWMIPNHCMLDH